METELQKKKKKREGKEDTEEAGPENKGISDNLGEGFQFLRYFLTYFRT